MCLNLINLMHLILHEPTGVDYRVKLIVLEIDENTETVQIQLFGSEIDFNTIQSAITNMGGSLHSIDEVEVHNETVAG